MDWSFRFGHGERNYNLLESAVAIQPRPEWFNEIRKTARSDWRAEAVLEETVEIPISSPYREIFERNGWIIAKATLLLAAAAETRVLPSGLDAVAQVVINENGEPALTTDLVVLQMPEKYSDEEALAQLAKDNLTLSRRLGFAPNLFQVSVPAGEDLREVLSALQAKPEVYLFAEPEILEVITGRSTPTDPELSKQWQHNHINSVGAWGVTRGNGVKVAVIDNGLEVSHPDLKDGIVGGGAFRLVHHKTIFEKFIPGLPFPSERHGTFCLGMAGARADNGFGGCGAAPEANLLAISCLEDQLGSQSTLARAVAYAADPTKEDTNASPADGADIISCSLGAPGPWLISQNLDLAIRFAAKNGRGGLGTPILWAVSNQSFELSQDQICSHPDVIAVGRSNQEELAGVCAFGPELAFLAPGDLVFSTTNNGGFGPGSGTSFAAPLAAGVAALVLSKNNKKLTAQQVRDRLTSTCDKIGGADVVYIDGHNPKYGHGRINAAEAVK